MYKNKKKQGLLHLLFYFTVTGFYSYALVFDTDLFRTGKYKKAGFPFDDSFGGRAKFLTYNNVVSKNIFFIELFQIHFLFHINKRF